MNRYLCACLNVEGEGAAAHLRVISAVITHICAGKINAAVLVVTLGAEVDLGVLLNILGIYNVNVGDVGLVPCGSLIGTYVYGIDLNKRRLNGGEYVASIRVHLYEILAYVNRKLTVVGIKALDGYGYGCGKYEGDAGVAGKLSAARVSLAGAFNGKSLDGCEYSGNVTFDRRAAEYVLALCKRTLNVDANEVVIGKTGVNNNAVLFCHIYVLGVESSKIGLTLHTDSVRSVLRIVVRLNGNSSTCLNGELNCTLNLNLCAVVSYRAVNGNSLVVLNCFKSCGSREIKVGVLSDLFCCVGILVNEGYGSSLTAEGEYYVVAACLVGLNCARVNGVIGNYHNGVVGVVSLKLDALEGGRVTNGVVGVNTGNYDAIKSGSLGSFLAGIDYNGSDVKVTGRKDNHVGILCEILCKGGGVRGCNTVNGVVAVSGMSNYGNGRACLNAELNGSAGLHIELAGVSIPSCLTCARINYKITKLIGLACSKRKSGINVVGGTGGAYLFGEVVVNSIVLSYLARGGIPGIKVGNVFVGSAEDYCKVSIYCRFISGKHLHTCNGLGDSTCAGVVILNELNGLVGGVYTVHGDVTLILVVSGIVSVKGDMSAEFGVDNCNCRVSAPGTADCGLACGNSLISGESTSVEDSAVGDSVLLTLVRALEGGEVAGGTLVILHGVYNVDGTVLKVGGIVGTEDEIGITGNVYVLEVLTSGEELEGILDTEERTVLHNEHISLNKECKASLYFKTCRVHSFLSVPIVGDGDVLHNASASCLSYRNGLSGVGNVGVSACILKSVERIPLDGGLILACSLNGKVGDKYLKLLLEEALADNENLVRTGLCSCKEVESLLNGGEHVVTICNSADCTVIRLLYLNLIYTVNDGVIRVYYVNGNLGINRLTLEIFVINLKHLCACGLGVEAGNLYGLNEELKRGVAKGCYYGCGKTCEVELFTELVALLEAVVEVNTVTGAALCAGGDSVEAELDARGLINADLEGDGIVFLIGNLDFVNASCVKVNKRGVDNEICEIDGIGLAVLEDCVCNEAGKIKALAYEVIGLTFGNDLEATLGADLYLAIKSEIEDVLSTAVLTAADNPLALGNVDVKLNNRASVVSAVELDIIYCSVGTCNSYKLSNCARGAVLDEEAELTCTGNAYLDQGGAVSDFDGSCVLNSVIGLGSVSDLRAGNDGELTVYKVSGKSSRGKIGYIKGVAYVLKCKNAADVTVIVTILVYVLLAYSGCKRLATEVTSIITILVSVVDGLAYVAPAVHTVCRLKTGSGGELYIVLNGKFCAALHTLACITTSEVPVVVTGCRALIALNLTAKSTYSVVSAVLCTGRILILLNVPLVNLKVVNLHLFGCTAAVITSYLLKTVGLCLAVCLGNYFFFTPEGVSLGIDFGCLGVIVITVCALENSNTGSAAGSRYKLRMPENILLILVDALFTKITYVVFVLVSVVGNDSVAIIALVIIIYVYVIADRAATDVTHVVIIIVSAYAELCAAKVTVVIGVAVSTLRCGLRAKVALMVFVRVNTSGKNQSTVVTSVVIIDINALGKTRGTKITLMIPILILTA